ncbi:MAG: hypothetical protein ACYCZ1_04700 [Candidatus Humimicrobiaceae bacterium]
MKNISIDIKIIVTLSNQFNNQGKFEGFTDFKLPLLEKVFKILT